MAYENYTIRQFMNAKFNNDRTVMNDEEFNLVNTEYIDTAGLYETEEFSDVSSIYYLNNRINSISIAIRLQKEFINNFDVPYIEGFKFFEKFGHRVYWNHNVQDFLKQLERVETKEKKYISKLEISIKNLTDKRQKKNNKEEATKEQSRGQFIRTLNSLGKNGYRIDKDKETVEDLAYMIKQQFEEFKNT